MHLGGECSGRREGEAEGGEVEGEQPNSAEVQRVASLSWAMQGSGAWRPMQFFASARCTFCAFQGRTELKEPLPS